MAKSLSTVKIKKLKSGSDEEGPASISEGAESVTTLPKPSMKYPKKKKDILPYHGEKLKHR